MFEIRGVVNGIAAKIEKDDWGEALRAARDCWKDHHAGNHDDMLEIVCAEWIKQYPLFTIECSMDFCQVPCKGHERFYAIAN